MVAPGAVDPVTSSTFVMVMSGAALMGVGSVVVLFVGVGSSPCEPSSLITAVLDVCITPVGRGVLTETANVMLPFAFAANEPMVKVQAVEAGDPSAQLQPVVLPTALKVV